MRLHGVLLWESSGKEQTSFVFVSLTITSVYNQILFRKASQQLQCALFICCCSPLVPISFSNTLTLVQIQSKFFSQIQYRHCPFI